MRQADGLAQSATDWLLEPDQPAVRYRALTDLLDLPQSDGEVKTARAEIPVRGWAHDILASQKVEGHWESADSLYRPKYTATNWMALVLSDLGLTNEHVGVRMCAELFLEQWLSEKEVKAAEMEVCVAGNTARMMTRFGYADDARVTKLFERLVEDQKPDGGWHCWKSATGSLDCWEALAAFAALPPNRRTKRIRKAIERGTEFYLQRKLFREGESRYRPWFRFHYPVHYYYDLLAGLDVLTSLGYGGDPRIRPALEVLEKKRRNGARWNLDRIHPDPPSYSWGRPNLRWRVKPFALERAGEPSKWVTLVALRVLKRVNESSRV